MKTTLGLVLLLGVLQPAQAITEIAHNPNFVKEVYEINDHRHEYEWCDRKKDKKERKECGAALTPLLGIGGIGLILTALGNKKDDEFEVVIPLLPLDPPNPTDPILPIDPRVPTKPIQPVPEPSTILAPVAAGICFWFLRKHPKRKKP